MRKTKGILLLIAALLVCLTVIFVGCDSGNTNSDNSGGNSNNTGNISNDSGNSSNDSGNNGDAKCSHNWNDATCTAPKTCSKCGETEGEALGHTWVDATCETPKTCSVCAETDGEALGHSWVDATCEVAKTCSVCDKTEGEALGHTWVDATCETPKICSVCAETYGEALGHLWVDATCEAPKTCAKCDETEGEALGHAWVDATCETPKTCSVCAETDGATLGGHDYTRNNICRKCGYNSPIQLDMSDVEKEQASRVRWIEYWSSADQQGNIILGFWFSDSESIEDMDSGNRMRAPAIIDVTIENINGEVVYSKVHEVQMADYNASTGEYQLKIHYTELSDISVALDQICFSVFNPGWFHKPELTRSVMPIVVMPELPKIVISHSNSTIEITDVFCSYIGSYLKFCVTGEKISDKKGSSYSRTASIGYKIYDGDGYLIASGTYITDYLEVGDKFKNDEFKVWKSIKEGCFYFLEFLNTD